jgi:predicted Rossmann-fold nucleotide-binding protein
MKGRQFDAFAMFFWIYFEMSSKRVCVYCASSDLCDQKFFDAGRRLGEQLARLNFTVVYGGAKHGVMGAMADAALGAQGSVIGWIPTFMKTEIFHSGLTSIKKDVPVIRRVFFPLRFASEICGKQLGRRIL